MSEGNSATDDSKVVASAVSDDSKVVVTDDSKAVVPSAVTDDSNAVVPTTTTVEGGRHWDHSTRKVVVRNIFKYIKANDLKRLMNSWTDNTSMTIVKHKKAPKGNWVVLTLGHDDMVTPFLELFKDGTLTNKKGHIMKAHRASEHDERDGGRDGKKRKDGDQGGGRGANKRAKSTPEECVKTPDEVRDKLTPLWKISYEKQLQQKTRNIVNKCLAKMISEMKAKFRALQKEVRRGRGGRTSVDPMYEWLVQPKGIKLDEIISAPQKYKYRNKSELTFGYRHEYGPEEGNTAAKTDISAEQSVPEVVPKKSIIKTPAVGFMAAGWSGGVSEPHCLQNIPDVVCGVADIVNQFLSDSPIPPYNSRVHQGIWRTLTIRTSDRTKECMIIITHAPSTGGVGKRDDGADDYSKVFDSEKERLTKMLTVGAIPTPARNFPALHDEMECDSGATPCDIHVTSLLFQEYEGLSNPPPEHPIQHVYGKEFLEERLLQCQFQISPGAFFQVTTEGAETLYNVVVEKVKEVAKEPEKTMLFDVCCGTGTIGLTCLKEGAVGKVVGIDISEPAIKDAIANVARNEFPSTGGVAEFVASRAEAAMNAEIKKVGDCPIVAVVDPAREGLHQDVCRALRNERKIQRIVYVSCNPTGSLVKDTVMLCCPQTKKYTGLPFKPAYARPVDMFPLTPHCELVVTFDRMTEDECNGVKKTRNNAPDNDGPDGIKTEINVVPDKDEGGGIKTENNIVPNKDEGAGAKTENNDIPVKEECDGVKTLKNDVKDKCD